MTQNDLGTIVLATKIQNLFKPSRIHQKISLKDYKKFSEIQITILQILPKFILNSDPLRHSKRKYRGTLQTYPTHSHSIKILHWK